MLAPGSSSPGLPDGLSEALRTEQGRRLNRGMSQDRYAPFDPEPQCPADARGLLFLGHDHKSRIAFTSDLCETEADVSRHYRRTIEHYERKDATSQQQVCAPGGTFDLPRADDDEALPQLGPRLRSQRASGVDPRHPLPSGQHPGHNLPEQGGFSRPQTTSNLSNPPSRDAAAQFLIEMRDASGERWPGIPASGHDLAHLETEGVKGFRGALWNSFCRWLPEDFGNEHPGSGGREVGEG